MGATNRRLAKTLALALGTTTIYGCASSKARQPPAEEAVTASGDSHFLEPHTLEGSTANPTSTSMPVSMDAPSSTGPAQTGGADTPTASAGPGAVASVPPSSPLGKAAPDLSVAAIGSSKVPTLSSLKGKVVVVHFCASWCTPCVKAIADLNAFAAKHKKKGVVVIGVSEDDANKDAAAFAKKSSAKFTMVWDTAKQTAGAYGVSTMPSTYVIDRKGNVVDVLPGAPLDTTALAKRL